MSPRALIAASAAVLLAVAVVSASQAPRPRTAVDGVYTNEQARYGEVLFAIHCESCHKADLTGRADANGDASPLVGDEFYRPRRIRTLDSLFTFMKANMPADNPGTLKDTDYAALIAYVLEWNEFPAGQMELPATVSALSSIRFEPEAATPAGNFELVQVVACLVQGTDGAWTASRASAPVDATAGRDATTTPLGSATFRLLNLPGAPDALRGQKVAVTGILIQDPAGNRLNVQSLRGISTSC